jgi:hypothetical protein
VDYKPHRIFRKSQYSVAFELPDDVFFDLMATLKAVNNALNNGYRLTGDDLITMALEDFCALYLGQTKSLLKRIGVT